MKNLTANIGLLLFGSFAAALYFLPTAEWTEENTVEIRGSVVEARRIERRKGSDALRIGLEGKGLPLRATEGFPSCYPADVVERLSAGSVVVARATAKELEKPPKDYLAQERFVPIYALQIDGETVVGLEQFNAWRDRERKMGKWVTLLLCAGAIAILFRRVRSQERLADFADRELDLDALRAMRGVYVDSIKGRFSNWFWAGLLILVFPGFMAYALIHDGWTWNADNVVAAILPLGSVAAGVFILKCTKVVYRIDDIGVRCERGSRAAWSLKFEDIQSAKLKADRYDNARVALIDDAGEERSLFVYPVLKARMLERADDVFVS